MNTQHILLRRKLCADLLSLPRCQIRLFFPFRCLFLFFVFFPLVPSVVLFLPSLDGLGPLFLPPTTVTASAAALEEHPARLAPLVLPEVVDRDLLLETGGMAWACNSRIGRRTPSPCAGRHEPQGRPASMVELGRDPMGKGDAPCKEHAPGKEHAPCYQCSIIFPPLDLNLIHTGSHVRSPLTPRCHGQIDSISGLSLVAMQ